MQIGGLVMKTVLIVEKNKYSRELYRKALTAQGYKIYTYESGEDALKHSGRNIHADLVILNLKMDDDTCFSVLEKLLYDSRNFKIVLTSANTIFRFNEITWLADAFFEEPANLPEMMKTVNNLLSA
jgi:DNA-binding response OmpR family regulator